MSEHTDKSTKEGEDYKDSLGQANPAQDLQKEKIKEVGEFNKKAAEDAKHAEEGAEPKEY